ncbi:SRPBCC family protein [Halobacteriovorax sp. HLS]|uniref:SRPBCC family protein n=1 Tax=Halobacteriovorax sp. HLS TaxID=2234000 RepID=UPI000FD7CFC0|nr:SRPBCC family protein [Halobacteriovorax sp. HLS]
MAVSASETIKASIDQVWACVIDIERAKDRIECIKDIEILEKPHSGVVGLKWRETREMFGKEAVETMWITEARENEYYITEANNCGCLYHSTISLKDLGDCVELSMSFKATAQSFSAKLMSPLMFLMGGMIKKAFKKDLQDIKKSLEGQD